MKKIKKLLSLLLAAMILTTFFAGCATKTDGDETQSPTPTPETTPTDNSGTTSFDYSALFDENGFWIGIRALDYVTLPDYSAIAVSSDIIHTVTDEEVDAEIESFLETCTTYEQVTDRVVTNGDIVFIEYVGSIDGVEFEGGNTNGTPAQVTAGSTEYIDDFLTQIIGHMPGETFDVNVTFPDPYENNTDYSGKEAVFVTTIDYIQGDEVPAVLNDEFVVENLYADYGITTVEEFRELVRTSLQSDADSELSEYLIAYLEDNSTVSEVPDVIIEFLEAFMVDWYQQYADYYGVDIETLISYYEGLSSVEELKEQYKDNNIADAKLALISQAVFETEGLEVTRDDVYTYWGFESEEDFEEYIDIYGLPYMKNATMVDVILAMLKETMAVG